MVLRQATRKEIEDAAHIEKLKEEQEEYREFVKKHYPRPELVNHLSIETTPEYNDEGGYDDWITQVQAYDANNNKINLENEDGDYPEEVREEWYDLPIPKNGSIFLNEVFNGPKLLVEES